MAEEYGFEISALYSEPGMAFCGKWENDGGDAYIDYGDCADNPDAVREMIGDEIDDAFAISDMISEMQDMAQ